MPPAARNEAFGDFGLPTKPRSVGPDVLVAALVALSVFALGAQLVTQWLAKTLEYQAALGEPLLTLRSTTMYAPWRAFRWAGELGSASLGAQLSQQAFNWLRLTGLLSFAAFLLVLNRRARERRNRAGEIHGSAKWAERKDIERAGLFASKGVVAGKWVDKKAGKVRYLRHNGPEHVLAFAPTGSGKGVGLVLPTLLTWQESALVLDPKGENFAKTSGWRQSVGQRVLKLDFAASPSETAAFNPLDAVRLGTAQETADAQRIARLIVDPDGKQFEGSNKHWAETASSLLTGAILHVLYRERLRGRSAKLADIVDELSDKHRSHAQVLLEWLEFSHDPRFTQGWQDDGAPTANHPVIAASAREQLNREEKERGAVLSSSVTPLALFRDPLLSANTSRSDFAIEDLMDAESPLTLYFVLRPNDIHRLRPIVRIVLDLALRRLVETMSFVGGDVVTTHRHKLLLMLDEFPILGKLDIFSEALAYIRGWGLKAYLICQDYEQLRATYGDREVISSNCQLQLAFAPNKYETAKHLSQLTGTVTVLRRSRSRSISLGAFASKRDSESEQEIARPLLTPDECMRLPGPLKRGDAITEAGDMLVFYAGASPIYAQQPLFFQDPTLLARSRIPPAPASPRRTATAVRSAPDSPSVAAVAQALTSTPDMVPSLSAPTTAAGPTKPEFQLDAELMALGMGMGIEDDHDSEADGHESYSSVDDEDDLDCDDDTPVESESER